MKKIDNMTVTTTYHVELKGVEVPDNVYDAILEYDKIDTGTIRPIMITMKPWIGLPTTSMRAMQTK